MEKLQETKKYLHKLTQKKSEYFRNINIKALNGNKKFWKKIKPFFSDKGLETNYIILKEKNELITSLLSHVSKVYERIIFNQISTYFEPYFSNFLTGFCKNHNTQHSLLKILELRNEALDKAKS